MKSYATNKKLEADLTPSSLFVSYAHKDWEDVAPFIAVLQKHYRVWFDEGLTPGKQYDDEIKKRIETCSAFLYLMTKESLASEYCEKEIKYAIENKKYFIGIKMSNVEFPAWFKDKFDSYQYLDASESSPENTVADLERKVNALRAAEKANYDNWFFRALEYVCFDKTVKERGYILANDCSKKLDIPIKAVKGLLNQLSNENLIFQSEDLEADRYFVNKNIDIFYCLYQIELKKKERETHSENFFDVYNDYVLQWMDRSAQLLAKPWCEILNKQLDVWHEKYQHGVLQKITIDDPSQKYYFYIAFDSGDVRSFMAETAIRSNLLVIEYYPFIKYCLAYEEKQSSYNAYIKDKNEIEAIDQKQYPTLNFVEWVDKQGINEILQNYIQIKAFVKDCICQDGTVYYIKNRYRIFVESHENLYASKLLLRFYDCQTKYESRIEQPHVFTEQDFDQADWVSLDIQYQTSFPSADYEKCCLLSFSEFQDDENGKAILDQILKAEHDFQKELEQWAIKEEKKDSEKLSVKKWSYVEPEELLADETEIAMGSVNSSEKSAPTKYKKFEDLKSGDDLPF